MTKLMLLENSSCFKKFNCFAIGTRRMEQRTPVIDKDTFWDVIDQLKEAGAKGILSN
jgi:ATP phosphoribosyltransferase